MCSFVCTCLFSKKQTDKQNIPLTFRAIEETPRSIYTIMDIFTLAEELTRFICHHNHQFNSINHNFVLKSVSTRVCIMKQMQNYDKVLNVFPKKYIFKTGFAKISVVKTKSIQMQMYNKTHTLFINFATILILLEFIFKSILSK